MRRQLNPGGALLAVVFALALVRPGEASAATACAIDRAKSAVDFTARMIFGLPITGRIGKFSGRVTLDEARPERSTATIVNDTASISTGDPDTEAFIRTRGMLDSANHPTARLTTSAFDPRGENRITVRGEFELKAIRRPVDISFRYLHAPDRSGVGRRVIADGSVEFSRLKFDIGAKDWSNTFIFHDRIVVEIHLEMVCPE